MTTSVLAWAEVVWLKRDTLAPARPVPPSKTSPAATVLPSAPDVVAKVRTLIEDRQIRPGSKLPPERVLAAELGVSRPALREAIKVLGGLGVLESRHGSGTFVKLAQPTAELPPALADGAGAGLRVLDLLEVRKILEPRAAWLAATRASERQMLEIETARQRLELRDQDWKLVAKLDYELHMAIFRGTQNPALVLIYEFLMSRILGNRAERVRFAPDVARMRDSHKAIVEAILKRQADAAAQAMIDHLHNVGMDYIREASL